MSQSRPPYDGGSTTLGDQEPRRRRGLWWLWILAAVVVLVLLLLLLSRCGGDDKSGTSAPASSSAPASDTAAASATPSAAVTGSAAVSPSAVVSGSPSTAPTAASSGAPGSGGRTGTLSAGSTSLLPVSAAAPQGTLSSYDGMPATGQAVTVLSVPADEGFWVGTSKTDRVWVQLTGSAESPYHVKAGDRVDLTGTVVPNGKGFAEKVGVSKREGAGQLTAEMSHIKASQGSVTLSTS